MATAGFLASLVVSTRRTGEATPTGDVVTCRATAEAAKVAWNGIARRVAGASSEARRRLSDAVARALEYVERARK